MSDRPAALPSDEILKSAHNRRSNQVFLFISSLISSVVGVVVLIYLEDLSGDRGRYDYSFFRNLFILVGGSLIIFGMSAITYLLLTGFRINPSSVAGSNEQSIEIGDLFDLLKAVEVHSRDVAERKNFSEADEAFVRAAIERSVSDGLSRSIITTIESKYGKRISSQSVGNVHGRIFDETIGKLEAMKYQAKGRALAYISWGLAITAVGLLILGLLIFGIDPPNYEKAEDKYFHYLSRLALFLSIEGVGIFLLGQFRVSMNSEISLARAVSKLEMAKLTYVTGTHLADDAITRHSFEMAERAYDLEVDEKASKYGSSYLEILKMIEKIKK